MKKQHLPQKLCVVCQRPFSWRKKMGKALGKRKILQRTLQKKQSINESDKPHIPTSTL